MLDRLGTRPALDGIRAVAIVGVVLAHTWPAEFPLGGLGVDMFFALSAFLITTLLMQERTTHGKVDFRAFYLRRAFRLGPALIVFLVLLALPAALVLHEASTIASSTLGSLFYVNDFLIAKTSLVGDAYVHTWSLALEEQFYSVWPVVAVFGAMRFTPQIRRRLLGLALVAAVLEQGLHHPNYFLPTAHIAPLVAGALAAELFLFAPGQWRTRIGAPVLGLVLLAALAGIATLHAGSSVAPWTGSFVGIATALLILNVTLAGAGPAGRLLSLRPMRWLGQRSYGLYLYHRAIQLMLLVWLGAGSHYAGPLAILLSVGFAEASFRFVESPVRDWGRQWLQARGHAGATGQADDGPDGFTRQADAAGASSQAVDPRSSRASTSRYPRPKR